MSSGAHVPNKHEDVLREFAIRYPEVTEDFPWGHRALKVKGKAFVFLVSDQSGLSLSVKLPSSHGAALMMPFAQPTGYGLGKAGWVSCQFQPKQTPPVEMLKQWIDESYRAVAPKKVLKLLEGGAQEKKKPVARKKSTPAAKSTQDRKLASRG
ncbi:MAG: MmcQ/YjbR family DNA-binding protein [Myxococcota bacterium]|nr:MmcQ/YjbR family DNA-binding protein [Myxococcota bacterium]